MYLARLAGDGEGCGHSFMSGGTENAADRAMAGFRLSPQQRRLWSLPGEAAAGRALAAVRVEGALDDEGMKTGFSYYIPARVIIRWFVKEWKGLGPLDPSLQLRGLVVGQFGFGARMWSTICAMAAPTNAGAA